LKRCKCCVKSPRVLGGVTLAYAQQAEHGEKKGKADQQYKAEMQKGKKAQDQKK
jgi:hypothetical protein